VKLRCRLLAGIGLTVLLTAAAPATSLAGPEDVTATQRFLRADYEYEVALRANVPLIRSAATGFAAQTKTECGDVLHGVEDSLNREETKSMRAFGENALRGEQLRLLGEELQTAGSARMFAPDQPVFQAFQSAVDALEWEDMPLSAAIDDALQEEHAALFSPPLDVCQDIRAWVGSGFHLLSPGTKAFLIEREAQQHRNTRHGIAIEPALKRFETSEGKTLTNEIAQLEIRRRDELVSAYEAVEGAQVSVGLEGESGPLARRVIQEIRSTTQLGHGTTAAKGFYTVSVTKGSGHCAYKIRVQGTGSLFAATPMCATRKTTVRGARCEEGDRVVEAVLPAGVREVRMRLSNGRSVTSTTIALPAKLGGPASIYFQAVPRGSAVPISLTELDRHGHTRAIVTVQRADKCVRRRLHTVSGGSHKLASGQIPGGPRFNITANAFAYNGPSHLSLSVEIEGLGGGGSSLGGAHPKILELTTDDGCYPVDYHIVYGILKATHDTVQAHVKGKVTELQRAKLPASLKTHGALVYGVFTESVESIIVRTPNGTTADAEGLEQRTMEQHEYCEGFIEPGRAPQEEGHLF
jgi:hypothetical protein